MRGTLSCLALITLLCSTGCNPAAAPTSQPAAAVERGPYKLYVSAKPTELWIGDAVNFELSVTAPADAAVDFPKGDEFGKSIDVRRVEASEPKLQPDGTWLWRQRYELEPRASGGVEIPALAVRYGPAATTQPSSPQSVGVHSSSPLAPAGQPVSQPVWDNELTTQPLTLAVKSALTSQDSVAAPREITAVLTPPREPLKPWQIALIAAGSLVGIGLITWAVWAIRRRLLRPAPPVAPEIWALQELGRLENENLGGKGLAREFYYRLTEIVRRYIELKFNVAAPEMTTEEFLNALARDRRHLPLDAPRLRDFLIAGDLVKYAAFAPGQDDAAGSLSIARSFIHSSAAAAESAAREAAAQANRPEAAA